MDKQNLIPFPAERVKRHRAPGTVIDLQEFVKDPRKSGALVSIFSVVLLAMSLNPEMETVAGGRSIASTPESAEHQLVIQSRLEDELKSRARVPASVGREPTMEDRLRAGELHGRYRLVYRDDYIAEIALTDENAPIRLKYGPKSFLESYGSIIHPGFDTAEKVSNQITGARSQTYQLKKNGQAVGRVHLNVDRYGKFYSLNVE